MPGVRGKLKKIVDHPAGVPFYEAAKMDIEKKGSRVAASVRGQFASFERTQPG